MHHTIYIEIAGLQEEFLSHYLFIMMDPSINISNPGRSRNLFIYLIIINNIMKLKNLLKKRQRSETKMMPLRAHLKIQYNECLERYLNDDSIKNPTILKYKVQRHRQITLLYLAEVLFR